MQTKLNCGKDTAFFLNEHSSSGTNLVSFQARGLGPWGKIWSLSPLLLLLLKSYHFNNLEVFPHMVFDTEIIFHQMVQTNKNPHSTSKIKRT